MLLRRLFSETSGKVNCFIIILYAVHIDILPSMCEINGQAKMYFISLSTLYMLKNPNNTTWTSND